MSSEPRHVLVVEDESAQRLMYDRALTRMGFTPTCVATSEEACERLATTPFVAAVLDLNLSGESGLDMFEHIRERHPQISVIIATGYGTFETAKRAIRMDAVDFLSKPIGLEDLGSAMDRAWARHLLVQTPIDQLTPPGGAAGLDLSSRESLNIERMEYDLIIEALRRTHDNRKAASKLLGISERKLYYRLSQFEIRPPSR